MKRIVVGIDGSQGAERALGWALDIAAQTGATVQAVSAFQLLYAWIDANEPDLDRWREPAERGAQATLDGIVDQALAQRPGDVAVTRAVVEAPPAQALLRAAADADLLVVGSRGLGGFKGLLLGSVSQQCVYHATGPVVVVRHVD